MRRPSDPRLAPIFSRYSCRTYKPDPIDPEDLEALRRVLRWSPSAGNAQPWVFYEVHDKNMKKELAAAAWRQRFVAQAPLVYAVCADPAEAERAYGERGRELYVYQDTAAATMSLLIAANALGYATCWVGAFDEDRVSRIIGIEPGLQPVALVPVGRPGEKDSGSSRKTNKKIFRIIPQS